MATLPDRNPAYREPLDTSSALTFAEEVRAQDEAWEAEFAAPASTDRVAVTRPLPTPTRWSEYKRIKGYGVVPGTPTTLLSGTSKMPCESFSLPAGRSCPGAVYGKGFICDSCFAMKNMYRQTSVQQAQQRRFDWARQCMGTPEGITAFVDAMVAAIGQTPSAYFRVHDSGDLFSPAYAGAWIRIVRALPGKRFWIPTRLWTQVERPLWHDVLLELAAQPNVTMRPSALRFDDAPPVVPGMAAGTTASKAGFNCPAFYQDNACGDCRACWDSPELAISYHKH